MVSQLQSSCRAGPSRKTLRQSNHWPPCLLANARALMHKHACELLAEPLSFTSQHTHFIHITTCTNKSSFKRFASDGYHKATKVGFRRLRISARTYVQPGFRNTRSQTRGSVIVPTTSSINMSLTSPSLFVFYSFVDRCDDDDDVF